MMIMMLAAQGLGRAQQSGSNVENRNDDDGDDTYVTAEEE